MKDEIWLLSWALAAVLLILGLLVGAEAQMPDISKMTQGLKVPGLPGKSGFSGTDAVSTAKELYSGKQEQSKTSYPTPNIGVSGNNVVVAWPNGVVTIETIAQDGTIHRTVLGPPTEKNS